MSINKRKSLTALQKKEICLAKEKILIPSNAELELAFDIGKTTVTGILNQKERWLEVDPESFDANKKKRRSLLYENIDQAMAIWVKQAIGACLDINGDILKEKAKNFSVLLGIEDFKASEGWLTKFKQRHNIKQYLKQGESSSAPISELPLYREDLKILQLNISCLIFLMQTKQGYFGKWNHLEYYLQGQYPEEKK